jgi:hypothetical protein
LEERRGKLALAFEKALVDVNSVAMQVFKAHQENGWRPPQGRPLPAARPHSGRDVASKRTARSRWS